VRSTFFSGEAVLFHIFTVKNFNSDGFFLVTLFLAVEEKVTGLNEFKIKVIRWTPRGMMARSVLSFLINKKP